MVVILLKFRPILTLSIFISALLTSLVANQKYILVSKFKLKNFTKTRGTTQALLSSSYVEFEASIISKSDILNTIMK